MTAGLAPATDLELIDLLEEIQQRVLWLATRMIDVANHDRPDTDGLKVGGHQASSASLVSVMTALWFAHLDGVDRVAVKPHASPVLHAVQYLLGGLDPSYLVRLRAFGGLQSYPSRTKDPDRVDFSTGSVGLGAAAPLFAAVTRRYVDAHFGARPSARFVALIGDAELDEGNIWEAIADPATSGLGNVLWIVDFNRQSLDRVVPGVRIAQWCGQFEAAGWHVVEVKYGHRLRSAFTGPAGPALSYWLDTMPNERYQSLFGIEPAARRARFLDGAPAAVEGFAADLSDDELGELIADLGGHDLAALLSAFAECDAVTDRPSVVFAYTIKGWGLPNAGHPRNHSALLSSDQVAELRSRAGRTLRDEWDPIDPSSAAGRLVAMRAQVMAAPTPTVTPALTVPTVTGRRSSRPISTQEVFGRVLVDLSRDPGVGPRLVTTAPDVATSTNLAGLINRTGVFTPVEQRRWDDDQGVKWTEGPSGRHVELGISEMNLFLLLGQLGLSRELSDELLIPVGTVYDPFVLRGLDAFVYSVYSGARFIVAGTPSGVSLAPEGGAHQSTITPSVGLELPGVTTIEPAYAVALDWLLCDAVDRVVNPYPEPPAAGDAYYFRLTTRRLDQAPFDAALDRLGGVILRRQVVAGGYRLIDATAGANAPDPAVTPRVTIAACGAVMPEALAAAAELAGEGVAADVVDITSSDRLYRDWKDTVDRGIRQARVPGRPGSLAAVFRPGVPVVTVHDAASHAMSWLGSALGVYCVSVGVDGFGQSGTVDDLYRAHGLDAPSLVNAALAAIELSAGR